MTEHNPFGETGCTRRIYEKRKILLWIYSCSSILLDDRKVLDGAKMLEPHRGIFFIAQQDNPVFQNTNLPRRFSCNLEGSKLRHQSLCARILQLKSQLFGRPGRVRRWNNTASPMASPCQCWSVDTIWCEECEHITFLPAPERFEPSPKFRRRPFHISIGIGSAGVGVDVDDWVSVNSADTRTGDVYAGWEPLLSGYSLSWRSNRKRHRSTLGISRGG